MSDGPGGVVVRLQKMREATRVASRGNPTIQTSRVSDSEEDIDDNGNDDNNRFEASGRVK
jgi:hypothetical protein